VRKILLFLLISIFLFPIELGGFIGEGSNARGMMYGVFASLSFFPMTRVEVEGTKFFTTNQKTAILSAEAGLTLSGVHPYLVAGVGINTDEEGSFHPFSSGSYFTSLGGGVKFSIFSSIFKVRLDFRKLSIKDNPYYRAYVGFLLSI